MNAHPMIVPFSRILREEIRSVHSLALCRFSFHYCMCFMISGSWFGLSPIALSTIFHLYSISRHFGRSVFLKISLSFSVPVALAFPLFFFIKTITVFSSSFSYFSMPFSLPSLVRLASLLLCFFVIVVVVVVLVGAYMCACVFSLFWVCFIFVSLYLHFRCISIADTTHAHNFSQSNGRLCTKKNVVTKRCS